MREGLAMLKEVGASGQISLGKRFGGQLFMCLRVPMPADSSSMPRDPRAWLWDSKIGGPAMQRAGERLVR